MVTELPVESTKVHAAGRLKPSTMLISQLGHEELSVHSNLVYFAGAASPEALHSLSQMNMAAPVTEESQHFEAPSPPDPVSEPNPPAIAQLKSPDQLMQT